MIQRYKGLSEEENDPRARALGGLEVFGRHAEAAVPILIEIIKDEKENLWTRRSAMRTLPCLGPKAKEAIPALRSVVRIHETRDPILWMGARRALEALEQKTPSAFPDP